MIFNPGDIVRLRGVSGKYKVVARAVPPPGALDTPEPWYHVKHTLAVMSGSANDLIEAVVSSAMMTLVDAK